jgi:hypothetical protein
MAILFLFTLSIDFQFKKKSPELFGAFRVFKKRTFYNKVVGQT